MSLDISSETFSISIHLLTGRRCESRPQRVYGMMRCRLRYFKTHVASVHILLVRKSCAPSTMEHAVHMRKAIAPQYTTFSILFCTTNDKSTLLCPKIINRHYILRNFCMYGTLGYFRFDLEFLPSPTDEPILLLGCSRAKIQHFRSILCAWVFTSWSIYFRRPADADGVYVLLFSSCC